jgi:trehalose utilization protein
MPTPNSIRITVWNEFRHEKQDPEVARLYPQGLHGAIAEALNAQPGLQAGTATLDEPEHGLTQAVLDSTDVLFWWGHMAHPEVRDEIVDRVQQRVLNGMGLVVLHSGHFSKILRRLLGTNCSLRWRDVGELERVWVTLPGHPIAAGLGEYFEIPHSEMYGEFFDIPQPDEQVFISWFQGGEVFRGGSCFYRGRGKIFYFDPGHETYPIYYQREVRQVLANAARWAAPVPLASFRELAEAPNAPKPMAPVTILP